MKLLLILFVTIFDLVFRYAFKLAMIAAALGLVVAIGMGLYWLLIESGAGLILLGITVLVIIMKVGGTAAGDSEQQ